MTWGDFFKRLEENGIRYFAGDAHYAGRGYWFPRPPTLDGSEAPRPPESWIYVYQDRANPAVFIETSFPILGSKVTYSESPEAADAAVYQAWVSYDLALGAEPLRPPPPPPVPPLLVWRPQGQGVSISDESWNRGHKEAQAAVEEKRRVWRERQEEDRRWVASSGRGDSPAAIESRRGLKDDDVSPSCGIRQHYRCRGCSCSCHA